MPRPFLPVVVILAAASHAPRPALASADAHDPVVLVELFTSEGCSSCPPADALLGELTRERTPGRRIVALAEHVDYWDGPAWRDQFSSPVFTRRQESYARRLGLSSVYTPQLVVAGRSGALGSDRRAAEAAIALAARDRSGRVDARIVTGAGAEPSLSVDARWADGISADVFVAIVQDRATTHVRGGENAGRTLEHVAVVRSLAVVGRGTGTFSRGVPLEDTAAPGARHVVVFVQERDGGPVIAATAVAAP